MAQNGHTVLQRGARAIALLLGAGAGFAMSVPAYAEKVGVAAAVNPDAFSSLSGVPNKQLNIGKSIFYNERIKTTTNGLVQVLLVDGSTFTVGPDSNLVIDKFVYDPKKKTGQVVATFSNGSMRFIGGKLSKNAGGVKVNTPSGSLAIRGGMFQGNTQKKIYSFLYGHSMTLQGRNGKVHTVYQPGYTLDLSRPGGNVRPTTAEDTAVFAKALSNRGGSSSSGNGGDGGSGGSQGAQQQAGGGTSQMTQTVSLQNLISDATQTATTTKIIEQLENLEKQDENTLPTNTPTPTNANSAPASSPPPPEPEVVDARIIHTDPDGLLVNDLVWTFTFESDRLLADIPAAEDIDEKLTTVYLRAGSAARLDFPQKFDARNCQIGFCPVENAKVTVDGETVNFSGQAVLRNDFFAYHVASNDSDELDRLLVFGGKKRNFEEPSGKVYVFALTSDVIQQNSVPFASANSTPDVAKGFVSPLLAKEPNTGGTDDPSRPVWLQSSFALGTGESDGESFVNVALGEWSPDRGLTGERRGSSDNNGENYGFNGAIASLAGPDGGHFLGADDENPNAVLTLGGAETELPGRDTPLHNRGFHPGENGDEVHLLVDSQNAQNGVPGETGDLPNPPPSGQSGSTYHIAAGTETIDGVEASSRTFNGYAAGFSQQAGDRNNIRSLSNNSPSQVTLALNGETNTLTSKIKLENYGDISKFSNGIRRLFGFAPRDSQEIAFGGEGDSALIDDNIFAAFEDPGASTTMKTERVKHTRTWRGERYTYYRDEKKTYENDTRGYIISADAMGANQVLFAGQTVDGPNGPEQKRAFCQNCDYMKWGAFGAHSSYRNYKGDAVTEDTHLGWWIAGDVVSPSDMPTTGRASYAGDAIGTVAKLNDGVWNQSVATGKMNMDWNFAGRRGTLSISEFDNKRFSGTMYAPGRANFKGALAGNSGLRGVASGSFVGSPGKGQKPRGVIGNFDVGKKSWQANGIWGGQIRRQP